MSHNYDGDDEFDFNFGTSENNVGTDSSNFDGDSEFDFNFDTTPSSENNSSTIDNSILTSDFSNSAFFDDEVDVSEQHENVESTGQQSSSNPPRGSSQQQNITPSSPPQGGTSKKKIGIIIFISLLILALVVSFLTKIRVTKTPKSSKTAQNSSQQVNQASVSDSQLLDLQNEVDELNQQLQESEAKRSELEDKMNSSKSNKNVSFSDLESDESSSKGGSSSDSKTGSAWQEIDASSINFNSDELETTGEITSKHIYLNSDNQLIYSIEIGVDSKVVESCSMVYYCPLNVYLKMKEKDIVTMRYRKSGSSISVVSLQK